MRILSIDLGDKRVGLAVCDPLGYTAQGLDSFMRKHGASDFEHIRSICREKKVSKCIVGLPLLMNGDVGPKAKETLLWTEELKKNLDCEVISWDERLTTRQVTRLMIDQGLSRQKQKERADQLSAILILQSYLDQHHRPSQTEDVA